MKLSEDQKALIKDYGQLFVNSGGNDIVDLIERNDINAFNNFPAVLLQAACHSQLLLLQNLQASSLLHPMHAGVNVLLLDVDSFRKEHSLAALKEGWNIFTDGRFENPHIERIDEPEPWPDMHDGKGITPQLESDQVAWFIVANGEDPHHVAARKVLETHNPDELKLVMEHKHV